MPPGEVNTPPTCPARLGVALALTTLGLIVACSPKEEAAAPPPKAAQAPARPAVIAPPPPLGRAELLSAMSAAASAHAAGAAPAADPLVGRTFAVRGAFGCSGPRQPVKGSVPPAGLADAVWSGKGQTIELSLTPADWKTLPLIEPAVASETWEAAEGFWIDRPWLLAEGCPVAAAAPPAFAPLPSPQTMGLAAVFEPQGSRFGRRNGRAYSFTVRGSGEGPALAPPQGYRVVLEGRMVAFPSGRAINCRMDGPDRRPVCVAAVQLDRVAFEDGATGEQLSEWRKD